MNNPDIIIVGAGVAGLMAARALSQVGKKILVLEARDRIGGRIYPLDAEKFGYPAQGGAEFIHGEAPITRGLVAEAGLHIVGEEGEIWSSRTGVFKKHEAFVSGNEVLTEKLHALTKDMSATEFLNMYFSGAEHEAFRNSVIQMIKGYDAADPDDISMFTLRDEWLGDTDDNVIDGWIKEGYGALLAYLKAQCDKNGVEFHLSEQVRSVSIDGDVTVSSAAGEYKAAKVIVTVPLPILKSIIFTPPISEKLTALSKIGYGSATKLLIRFKSQWWKNANGHDLSKMAFLLCNEPFLTWWTPYSPGIPILVGWLAGPESRQYSQLTKVELLDMGAATLSRVLNVDTKDIMDQVEYYDAVNWPADPLTKGAYSYTKVETSDAYDVVREPIQDAVYFAGEALNPGNTIATVEGALASGLGVAQKILITQ